MVQRWQTLLETLRVKDDEYYGGRVEFKESKHVGIGFFPRDRKTREREGGRERG